MKQIAIIAAILLIKSISGCTARDPVQQVTASAGDYFSGSYGSISFTVGECISGTLQGYGFVLTQGFQQNYPVVTGIPEDGLQLPDINVYPNPAGDHITLKIGSVNPVAFTYELLDMTGRLVLRGEIRENETDVPVESLNHSVYILKILHNKLQVKLFRIIKN
jgi:hypothetical protein